MGTAALVRQRVSRRPPRLFLPEPRGAVDRPSPRRKTRPQAGPLVAGTASNVLRFRRPRARLRAGVALPAAGLLIVLTVVPALGALRERGDSLAVAAAASDTGTALAGYLISEPIHPEARVTALPQALRVVTYRVKRGDSLSGIAQRFGLSVDTLISFNNVRRARSLSAGTELRVPSADGLAYTVRRGDTLLGIAQRHGITLESLLDWNALESDVVVPGQVLFVPGARLPASVRDSVLGKLIVYPARGELSSRFGWRLNPFTGLREHHNGIDISARIGTPVVAAMAGRVAMAGVSPVYGKYLILTHAGGYQTLYGHLNRALVAPGATVAQGQRIGEVGNTGYSTGSHLHFTVFRNGVPVDPVRLFE
jgi:murein DD-endopeptidase MepM/ murein hydrolase activator NlpD